tara:strand:+ start:1592 stop:1993 length:402 start_codon:yes stop_codon:yes gene_type:complete
MPALEKDTKLVMTILFVGAISGTNVYFYGKYGSMIAFGEYAHALIFGLMTIGAILAMKAIFDLALNDRIEMLLLDRRISAYWAKKQRDEQQREKIRQSMYQNTQVQSGYMPVPPMPVQPEEPRVPTSFLAQIE